MAQGGENQTTMKMKQLVEASGVPKSTILLYVEKGLLPRPRKTSPNVAHYDASCVERLARIKHLQMEHGLPLDRIAKLLEAEDQGQDITPLVELNRTVFGDEPADTVDRAEFLRRTGLPPEGLDALLEIGMLLPMEQGRFDDQDVAIGAIMAQGMTRGLSLDDIRFYPELGRQIVAHEMELRRRVTSEMPFEEDAEVTRMMVQQARAMRSYVIDRLFQQRIRRSRHLKDYDNDDE